MSENSADSSNLGMSRADELTALFANLVLQQSNMAMLLMGKAPTPDTGQTMRDLDAARLFIDQLEMLQEKTKGNLSKEEQGLLNGNLTALRMAFVEAVESGPPSTEGAEPSPSNAESTAASPGPQTTGSEESSPKKFTKKY